VLTVLSEGPLLERARWAKISDILLKGEAVFDDVLRTTDAATRNHA